MMDEVKGRGGGRQWRRRGGCDAGWRGTGGGRSSGGGRTTGPVVTRTFLALAAATAQDLTDRDGVARPLFRRGALRLTVSRRTPAQRLGAGYLRIDPPTPEELARAVTPAPPHVIGAAPVEGASVEPLIEDAEIVSIEEPEDEPAGAAGEEPR